MSRTIPTLLATLFVLSLTLGSAAAQDDDDFEETGEDEEEAGDGSGEGGDGEEAQAGEGGEAAGDGAEAAPALPSLEGRLRLGLELTLIDYEAISMNVDETMTSFNRNVGTVGLTTAAGLGVVGGYGLSDELLLSASVTLAHASASFGASGSAVDTSVSTFRFEVTPGIEYAFGAGKSQRPFVGGILGLRYRSSPVGATEIDELSLVPGAQAGLHYFMNNTLSFDARLVVAYLFGLSTSSEGAFGPTDYSSSNGPAVLLVGGMSFWN